MTVGVLMHTAAAHSFEAYRNYPGSRAMGMAGGFSAQADDSSAIWYNPAGLTSSLGIDGDFSIEVASVPTVNNRQGKPDSARYGNATGKLKFIGAYVNYVPFFKDYKNVSTGLALFKPYDLSVFVNENRDATDPAKLFGTVNSKYHQASAMLTKTLDKRLSIGGTADFVWTDIDCKEQGVNCVGNGPSGYGLTLGALYHFMIPGLSQFRVGIVWKNRAELDYSSTANPVEYPVSLGRELPDYLPGRPEHRTLALNMQTHEDGKLINLNVMTEQILWSKAAGNKLPLADYNKYGGSTEIIFTGFGKWTTSLRAGFSLSKPDNTGPDITTWALGTGAGYAHRHFIDLAYETRKTDADANTKLVSLSYSCQFIQ